MGRSGHHSHGRHGSHSGHGITMAAAATGAIAATATTAATAAGSYIQKYEHAITLSLLKVFQILENHPSFSQVLPEAPGCSWKLLGVSWTFQRSKEDHK